MNKAGIFIDGGHLNFHLVKKGWRIDFRKLFDYFIQKGFVPIGVFYYEGTLTEQSYSSRHPGDPFEKYLDAKKAKKAFFNFLRGLGFIVRTKPVHRLYDHDSQAYKFKCNFDVEMTIDMMEMALTKEVDTFIICSGDGDLCRLVKYLKGRGKKVLVVAFKECLNSALLTEANETVLIEAIRGKIEYQ